MSSPIASYPGAYQIRPLVLAVVLSLGLPALTACGGGGGSGGGTVVNAPAQQQESPEPVITNTALTDNVVEKQFSFEQFNQQSVAIDMLSIAGDLTGDYYILKLFDDDKTYYLGTTDSLVTVELALSLPKHITSLWVEIYSNTSSGQIQQEITL